MRGPNLIKTARARRLRSDQTDAEAKLWRHLRSRQMAGHKFVRRERHLVIEVDGGQHADSPADRVRDAWLRSRRYQVLRFWNNDVLTNIEGVLTVIHDTISR
jgi:very-short-patch-repair endonuclease